MDVEAVRALLRQHHVAVAYLFGSRARGTANERSDYDLAVLFRGEPTLGEVGALQSALSGLLGTAVDLIELDRASLELQAAVIQEGTVLLRDDEPRRVAFEVATRSRWFDYRPVLQELTAAYLARVAAKGL
jgi:predicted nucleotidyltransferase